MYIHVLSFGIKLSKSLIWRSMVSENSETPEKYSMVPRKHRWYRHRIAFRSYLQLVHF